nr:ABC transporter substrate-binding protein [Bradyrhizobium sp. STM 3843]
MRASNQHARALQSASGAYCLPVPGAKWQPIIFFHRLEFSAQMYHSRHKCVNGNLYLSAELGNRRRSMRRLIIASLLLCGGATSALAEFSDNKIIIGVMGDQSGVVADVGGPGSILAARMAVEDSGGTAGGVPVEIITADHQNKPEVASAIAREWFDRRGVDVIVDLPHSGVVFGLMAIATEKKRSLMISGAASVEITGGRCSPFVTHWTDDTYSLARGTAAALMQQDLKSWYFLTADYAFGHDLEKDATRLVEERGGKVIGSARHPLGTADFSALLLRAKSSQAQVVALASAGADTVNAIKQAGQFGIMRGGQRVAALHAFVTDINSVGLEAAQGLIITTGFYWNDTDGTRAFSERFFKAHGRMPTREQAGVYTSVLHYLKAADKAKSDDAAIVNAEMRKLPVDKFGQQVRIQENGRVIYDLGVYRVKSPAESKAPWDYYERIATVPADTAFRSIDTAGCAAPSVR